MPENIRCLHNYEGGHDKLYVARIDEISPGQFQVVGCWGKASATLLNSQPKGNFDGIYSAQNKMNDLIDDKIRGGYVNIESPSYRGRFTVEAVMEKVDCSRLAGTIRPLSEDLRSPSRPQRSKPTKTVVRKSDATRTIAL